MSQLPTMIDSYLSGANQLAVSVMGMTEEQLKARPVEGKWSTLEVVCHIADFDPILADRMKRIIALDRPPLVGADENRFAATLAYQDRDLNEELSVINVTRWQMARILGKLPPEALQRVGVHSERGEMSLEKVLTMAINHITHHLPFIHEKRKALGLPA